MAELSRETLRRILHAGGVSWQTTTTWNPDPAFLPKMRRVLDLYDHPPAGGRVVCVDEFGPLNLLPRTARRGGRSASPGGCGRPTPDPPDRRARSARRGIRAG